MNWFNRAIIGYVLSIFSLLICACSNPKSFIGTIDYKVSTIVSEELSNEVKEYYKSHFGDSLSITFYESGDISMKYYGSEKFGYNYFYYVSEENMSYTKFHGNDTIYQEDCSVNYFGIGTKERFDDIQETILGQNSKLVVYQSVVPETTDTIRQEFYFTGKPYLNHRKYRLFNASNFHSYLKESNSVYLKRVLDFNVYQVTYEAFRITHDDTLHEQKINFSDSLNIKLTK